MGKGVLAASTGPEAVLDVMDPIFGKRPVRLAKFPFQFGRGSFNDLLLLDSRISRKCAAIVFANGGFRLEDRGNQLGVFLDGEKIDSCDLRDGGTISFGVDSYSLIFHVGPAPELLDAPVDEAPTHALRQMGLLLEAAALAQSELPMEDILATLVDRAIEVSGAERGILLYAQEEGGLEPIVARRRGSLPLSLDDLQFPERIKRRLESAIETRKSILGMSTGRDEAQRAGYADGHILASCCVPLRMHRQMRAGDLTHEKKPEKILGAIYLDSPYFDSNLVSLVSHRQDQILDALAAQAATVLANVRLVQMERDRRQMEQELAIARGIQQALLPKSFKHPPHIEVSGINRACLSVGGDYFDLMNLDANRTAFVIADVSGKGLGAALVTSMLQGMFSAMMLGTEPVGMFDHTNRLILERTENARYATLFFGTLFVDGELQYVNAGHVPPLLLRSGLVQPAFCAEAPPVGLLRDAEYKVCSETLQPGDALVLYTDGVTEAMDPGGNLFGIERLIETTALNANASVNILQESILEAVNRFAGGANQYDDITLLILRYNGCP